MRQSLPRLGQRIGRVLGATAIALVIAASTTIAQFGTFDPAFDGQLWAVRHEVTPPDDGLPAGVAFSSGTLFIVDAANKRVLAYDVAGNPLTTAHDDWNATAAGTPVFGFEPNQLFASAIDVDGVATTALFLSDGNSNRVAAFDTTGHYLFTLRLQRPSDAPLLSPSSGHFVLTIGQMAMSPGAKFSFTTATQGLTLSGSFAAAWREQITSGAVDSGAMVLQGPLAFSANGAEFDAIPTAIKRGNEDDPSGPVPAMVFGVAFDSIGNLYVLDTLTERLHAYGPALDHLFTFGTPVADGTTAEFHEPWGMAFWPDATGNGGRLFINDTYKSRVMVYRPFDGPDADSNFDGLQLETTISGFLPPHPAIYMNAIAVDPSSGSIAITDFAEDDGSYPRAVVLQQRALAAFDVQLLDAATGGAVQSVCTGAGYQLRFSLTVPAGHQPVHEVAPRLLIDGTPAAAAAIAAGSYPSPMTLSPGDVATYTYDLTAPSEAGADIAVLAGGTASDTSDILERSETIAIADCAGETDPSTIAVTQFPLRQVSGWTPVYEGDVFAVTLTAQDDDGIESVEYQLEGANESGEDPVATGFDGVVQDAIVPVPIPGIGHTTLTYRMRDGNGIWSPWQAYVVRTRLVVDRLSNENGDVSFIVGDPEGAGFFFSVTGLPAGVSFSTTTGQFGGVVSYDANDRYSGDPAVASGVYDVVVTETASDGAASSVSFTWTVNNIDRAPVANVSDQFSAEGETVSFTLDVGDPDGDPLTYSMNGLPPSFAIVDNGSAAAITGTFDYTSAGVYTVNVAAVGAGGVGVLETFVWTVADTNRPPAITAIGDKINDEGDAIVLAVSAVDPDGDTPLIYGASNVPDGLSINPATGAMTGTLSFISAGVRLVTITVTDSRGGVSTTTFNWTVNNVNRPPGVTNPGTQTSAEGATVSKQILAADPDGQSLTYSATGLPPGLSINSSTGLITGSLGYSAAGTYTVTVTATDGSLSDSETFTWMVTDATNVPPVCTAAVVSPGALWPPNHKPQYLTITGVTDPDGGTPSIRFTSVLQDESTQTTGDGNTLQDAGIENGGSAVWVRAERKGDENAAYYGRVYIVGFTATDAQGASCSGTVFVGVPHDQGNHDQPIPGPGRWNSITGALIVAPPATAPKGKGKGKQAGAYN